MDVNEMEDALREIDRLAAARGRAPGLRRYRWMSSGTARRKETLKEALDGMKLQPGDFIFMPIHMDKPGHFCALLWEPTSTDRITYCEPLDSGHSALRGRLNEWKAIIAPSATVQRSTTDVRMSKKRFPRLCGWCVINDYLNLVTVGELRPEAPVPPTGMASRELFANYVRAAFERRVAASVSGAPPKAGKPKRAHRPVSRRIELNGIGPGEDDGGPPNFRSGLLRLQRTGIEMEAAALFQSPLRELLECQELSLPTDRSILRGLSFDQRKRHLYTLDTLMEVILRYPADYSQLPLPCVWIKAIDQLQEERAWRSPGALFATASTLMGALERLNQYTLLAPIRLTSYSQWRDALKHWEKKALRVLPDVTAVTLEEVRVLLSHLSPDATALLLIAWLHAARVGNVFTVKVKESEVQTSSQGVFNWVITWTAAKTTPKVGAYTTHSAVPATWMPLLKELVDGKGPNDYLVHPSRERALVTELRAGLQRLDPRHDLRSLRRGSLTAMAKNGVDLETLLTYSGHRTVEMLLRYLQRGKVVQQRIQKGAAAALKSLH